MPAPTLRRVNRRLSNVLALVGAAAVSVALAACDTGDGKTLQDYDPADYPSQTVPPSSIPTSDGIDTLDDPEGEQPSNTVDPASSGEEFQVFAPWQAGGTIDVRNTCDGDDVSPAVSWGAVPAGTVEIAIAMVDDSVVSDGQPYVHWVISGLDPAEIAIVEGDVPAGAIQALNFFGNVGYGGPCPPPGDDPHLYRLTAYALNTSPEVADGTPAAEFLDAVTRVTIGSTDLTGTYQR